MAKLLAATALLKGVNAPLDAGTFMRGLALAGLAVECEYLSSSGSGVVKRYWSLTEAGLAYGQNIKTISPVRTEPRFDPDRFTGLVRLSLEGLMQWCE